MVSPVNVNLSEGFLQRWQVAKDYVNQNINSLTNSAQQLEQSLQQTTNTATDKAIDAVTTTLGQSWQTAEQIKNTTSGAIQTAINSSVNDWLVQHPIFLRLAQILSWASNHPIISLIILLFAIALIWSIIKAIIRLIETASFSILKVPLKLFQSLIKFSVFSFNQVGNLAVQRLNKNQILDEKTEASVIYLDKKHRLTEIATRLQAIQQEQQELLQEASILMAEDTNIMNT
jgi:hypothetical protein